MASAAIAIANGTIAKTRLNQPTAIPGCSSSAGAVGPATESAAIRITSNRQNTTSVPVASRIARASPRGGAASSWRSASPRKPSAQTLPSRCRRGCMPAWVLSGNSAAARTTSETSISIGFAGRSASRLQAPQMRTEEPLTSTLESTRPATVSGMPAAPSPTNPAAIIETASANSPKASRSAPSRGRMPNRSAAPSRLLMPETKKIDLRSSGTAKSIGKL